VPVPASVFDDEFFTKGNQELHANGPWTQGAAQRAETAPEPEAAQWPEARVPSFAGYVGDAPPPPAESDELDIPAFLRRNH
jgi:cell division protein FtsZ